MAYKFSLATVLRLREIAEEREERLLGQILAQMTQCRQTIADLQQERIDVIRDRNTSIIEQTSGVEIQASYEHVLLLETMEANAIKQLSQLDATRQHQLKVYETAHRNTELLEELRGQQREVFLREQRRHEQNMADDNFSARRSFR